MNKIEPEGGNNPMGKLENIVDDVLDLVTMAGALVGFYALGTILVKILDAISTL